MQHPLPAGEYAASMYSFYRILLDSKSYKSSKEKADIEQQLLHHEQAYLQAQDKGMLFELGFTPIKPADGHAPSPGV